MDYRSFDLPAADPKLCQSACAGEANCKAFTYVRPGVQGPSARCWLKSSVPNTVNNDCCVSGVKTTPPLPPPPPLPPLGPGLEGNTDRPGMDYRSFDLPAADPKLCQSACAGEANCKAFTYVRPGVQGPSARCWLKSSVPNTVNNDCCVSGVKTTPPLPPPPLPPLPITQAEIIGKTWQFGRGDGSIIAQKIKLLSNGKLEGYSHPNESRWGIESNKLIFYHESGKPATIFESYTKEGGLWIIRGPLLGTGGATIHVLKEVVTTQQGLPSIPEPVIYTNGNIAGVQNNPTKETAFTVPASHRVTYIYTYHYFNSGKLPGTIGLKHSDGTVYGPWQAEGALGQGGVLNAYWFVRPNVEIKAGTYTVIDSDKATWSHNSGSSGAGFVEIRGIKTGTTPPPAIPVKPPPQPIGSAVQLDSLTSLQIIKSVASQGSAAFKKNENLRNDLVMQTTTWDKTPYTMYEAVYNLILKSSRKVLLSGNAQASTGWNVDNFLFLEVFNYSGKLLKQVVIGNHEPVMAGSVAIEKMGDNKFDFGAGEIDITKLLPINEPFLLRASAVDYGGVGATSNVFLTLPSVTPPVTQQGLPSIPEPVIYTNGNIAGVQNNPTKETTFTIDAIHRATFVYTYHYFNSGKLPGTIGLRHSDGTVYGPWQSEGALGQGGVLNAYWFVRPNVEIKPGSYTVIDSDKATWSQNSGSAGAGFVEIRGIKTGTTQPPSGPIKPPSPTGSAVQLDSIASLQIIKSIASQGSSAFKKNENLRTDLVMQTSSWDKTPYKMYEGVYNLFLKSARKVLLSGNAQASEGWNVDNFLYLEVFNYSGKLLKQVVIGNHEPVLAGNVAIEKLGGNKFDFAAGEIDITNLLPVNEPFVLRASAIDYGGVGAASNVFLTLPPITTPPKQQSLPSIPEPVIYTNGNIAGVQNNPTRDTTFTVPASHRVTYIYTYHYFNSGKLPGTIGLRHSDGTVYGPWQSEGALGQGGVLNAYWFVRPNVEIKAGTYTVIDSDKATWSHNSGSSGAGFVEVRGVSTGTTSGTQTRELLTGTNLKGLSSWTIHEWMQPTTRRGEVTEDADGIRFRSGAGNTRMGIMQTINVDVSGAQKVILTAVVKAVEQTLDGTGWQGREAPVSVLVTYTDVNGQVRKGLGSMANPPESQTDRMFWQGFYYADPTGNSRNWNGTKVSRGSWYTYEFDLMSLNPKPKTIHAVGAEGSGWPTREGKIQSLSLKYYGNASGK